MANYNKYQKLKKQYSYDGVHWSDVEPAEYKLGEVIEENSTDCGAIEPQYRWYNADPSVDYICSGYNKFYKQYYQVSYDGGNTWENVQPIETQIGEIAEPNSFDCDYGVSWEIVDNMYICENLSLSYPYWVFQSDNVPTSSNFTEVASEGGLTSFTLSTTSSSAGDNLKNPIVVGELTTTQDKIYIHIIRANNLNTFKIIEDESSKQIVLNGIKYDYSTSQDLINNDLETIEVNKINYIEIYNFNNLKTLKCDNFNLHFEFPVVSLNNIPNLYDLENFSPLFKGTANLTIDSNVTPYKCELRIKLHNIGITSFTNYKINYDLIKKYQYYIESNANLYDVIIIYNELENSYSNYYVHITDNPILKTVTFTNNTSFTNDDAVFTYVQLYGNTKLTSVNFNNIRTRLHSDLFKNCNSLKTISNFNFYVDPEQERLVGDNKTENMFYNCESLTEIDMTNHGDIGGYIKGMFYNCKNLKKIDFSGCTTTVCNKADWSEAFSGCTNLEEIIFGEIIVENGCNPITSSSSKNFFKNCNSLKKINISKVATIFKDYIKQAIQNAYLTEQVTIVE